MIPLNHISRIPDRIMSGLVRYHQNRIEPGGFLMAVLEDRLFEAMSRADDDTIAALPAIVTYIRCKLAAGCWGSREAVRGWLAGNDKSPWGGP